MRILLYQYPADYDKKQFCEWLDKLPEQRRSKALKYRRYEDQVLSVAAYMLLCRGLEEEYGMTEKPEFIFGSHGKPSIKGHPEIHFNLSHCPKGAICVLHDSPVGVDIEAIPELVDEDVLNAAFSEVERRAIQADADPCARFAVEWTRKEAFLKRSGEGLTDNLPMLFAAEPAGVQFQTTVRDGFAYTVCY